MGQESLFGGLAEAEFNDEPSLIDVASWGERERLGHEKELLGFYVSGHPLGEVAKQMARYCDCTATTWESKVGREVRIGGLEADTRYYYAIGSSTAADSSSSCPNHTVRAINTATTASTGSAHHHRLGP